MARSVWTGTRIVTFIGVARRGRLRLVHGRSGQSAIASSRTPIRDAAAQAPARPITLTTAQPLCRVKVVDLEVVAVGLRVIVDGGDHLTNEVMCSMTDPRSVVGDVAEECGFQDGERADHVDFPGIVVPIGGEEFAQNISRPVPLFEDVEPVGYRVDVDPPGVRGPPLVGPVGFLFVPVIDHRVCVGRVVDVGVLQDSGESVAVVLQRGGEHIRQEFAPFGSAADGHWCFPPRAGTRQQSRGLSARPCDGQMSSRLGIVRTARAGRPGRRIGTLIGVASGLRRSAR
jgi:hypothetical protein